MRKRILIRLILFIVIAAHVPARAQELWSVALGAKPAQAPLVADIHDAAGPETIVVLENGAVRAIQADGVLLWSAELGAPPVAGSEAALTPKREGAAPLLIAPLTGGTVVALNAATGAPAWKATASLGEGPAWAAAADLDGDATADAVVASASGTAVALSGTDGALLWEHPGGAAAQVTTLSGPPCVADIDDDDAPEIFLAGKEGVLSLDAEGTTRFFAPVEGGACGGAAASDTDDDGTFEVYCMAAGAKLHALDANTGEPLWGVVLEGEDAASPRLAVADIDQDETGEVLVVGKRATIVSHDGKAIISRLDAGAGPAIGDVNSDGEIEIALGTGAEITLLDAALQPVGKVALAAAAQTPPVFAAINGAMVLCVGEDNALRAVRAGARLMGQLAPWTQPRRDATGSASTLSPLREQDRFAEAPQLAPANAALSFAGGFEDAALAAQWKPETADGAAAQDTATKASGAASLKTTAGAVELRVTSPAAAALPELRRVNASVLAKGAGARAFLAWDRLEGAPALQELRAADTTPEGWRRYRLSNAAKPAGARKVRLVLVAPAGAAEPVYWDDVQANGQSLSVPYVAVYSNQLGYEVKSPKRFTAATTFSAPQGTFRLLNEAGDEVYQAALGRPERITGANESDWGKYFWRGDFSSYDEPGKYKIEINIDGNTTQTGVFEIAPDLLWSKLYGPLSGALTAARCTPEAGCPPGCLWKETDPAENTGQQRQLNEIYTMILWRLVKPDSKALAPLAHDVQWGAEQLLTRVEAALAPGAAPDTQLTAALAGAARIFPQQKAFTEAARRLYAAQSPQIAPAQGAPALDLFSAALDLFVASQDPALAAEAKRYYPGASVDAPEAVVRYENEVDEMALVSFDIGRRLSERADAWLKLANNPFGLCTRADDGKPDYFGMKKAGNAAPLAGNTYFILSAAREVAQAYRYNPKIEYHQFILDQFNWVLGNNPLGLILLHGGAVSDGIQAEAAGVDRPALAPAARAPLRNTLALLDALANIKRIRMAGALKATP